MNTIPTILTTLLLLLFSLAGCMDESHSSETNDNPIAHFTWIPSSPLPGEDIQLHGKNLGEGKIIKWRWDFAGMNATDQNPIVRMPELGPNDTFSTLWVVLIISDEEDKTSKHMGIITTPRT